MGSSATARHTLLPVLRSAYAGPLVVLYPVIETTQPRLDLGVLADLAGKTIILGVIDLANPAAETADQAAARIRAGLARVPPTRLIPAPDCGMKYLPRATAFGKLRALSEGARAVREQIG